jgi:hypothetical protein
MSKTTENISALFLIAILFAVGALAVRYLLPGAIDQSLAARHVSGVDRAAIMEAHQ